MNAKIQEIGKNYALFCGDSAELLKEIPANSIDYILYSVPFLSLYTYGNSDRDLGNCRTDDEFYIQFGFITDELLRVLKPGRLMSIHCMDLPTSKEKDGYIGIKNFRGDLITHCTRKNPGGWEKNFIFHSEVCIFRDPVQAMQRTKALGLLHKQLKKDSCLSRQGIPDFVITFRKPGDNPDPVTHTNDSFPVSKWQRYASPVWTDINYSDTLNYRAAKEGKDERHICPLALPIIERCYELWTSEGDTVLTPFLGIGSEAYMAVKMGRKAVGIELKDSYYRQAVANVKSVAENNQGTLFDMIGEGAE